VKIAIDGPAGSGKSTVARAVADRLGYLYIDTGAMYRAVAYRALQDGISIADEERVTQLVDALRMHFVRDDAGGMRLIVDGEDVSDAIRAHAVSQLASPVSALRGVRQRLVQLQRQMGADGSVVMEGRDIQTVVLPDAEVKIFVTASDNERARRRHLELRRRGEDLPFDEVKRQMQERDERDSQRSLAPLARAPDAVEINTDRMSIEEVVQAVLQVVGRKAEQSSEA
jgi:cytidylate kinase